MNPKYLEFLRSDGRMHYSDLKHIASSGAHFISNLNSEIDSASTRIGSVFHDIVLLGKKPCVFEGTRRGAAWEVFKEKNIGNDICNVTEYETAMRMADSLFDSQYESAEFARDILRRCEIREKEILLDFNDVPWSSRIDAMGTDLIAELKSTKCASKRKFLLDAKQMKYDGQLAIYNVAAGVNANQFPAQWLDSYVIAVENKSPYIVAVYEVEKLRLDSAYLEVIAWQEKWLKSCETGIWGGYGKACETWDADIIIGEDEDDDEE